MMKLIYVLIILLGLQFTASAESEDLLDAVPPAFTNQEEVYAEVNTQLDGVDFGSWESDFNKSVRTQEAKCKGRNCQFKNKQALDPAWDL